MQKVLILRFSSIGDIVLTTPVIRCLKKQLNAEVHYFTKKSFASILQANPYVDKVHLLEDDLKAQLKNLKTEQYDCIIDLHHNIRTFQIKKTLKVPSYSFNKLNIEKWLLVRFGVNRMPNKHIVDRYMETVASLGIANDGQGLDYFIPEKDELTLSEVLPPGFKKYTGFVIGGQHATKMLPESKIIALCQQLQNPVVLLGGPEDAEKGERIAETVGSDKVFNACGIFNLHQSASLVKQAQTIITHDTGLMHIAAAFKKRIYSVWGNTVPEFGMYPYLPGKGSEIMEVKGLNCRPCSKIGHDKCPKGHFRCMEKQDVGLIKDKVSYLKY